MTVEIPEYDKAVLKLISCDKKVLDIGTGRGGSANLINQVASSVLTVENDLNYRDIAKDSLDKGINFYFGDWRDIDDNFDLVLIDHFPFEDRIPAAKFWKDRGSEIMIHDARYIVENIRSSEDLNFISLGHLHNSNSPTGFLHISKYECRHIENETQNRIEFLVDQGTALHKIKSNLSNAHHQLCQRQIGVMEPYKIFKNSVTEYRNIGIFDRDVENYIILINENLLEITINAVVNSGLLK